METTKLKTAAQDISNTIVVSIDPVLVVSIIASVLQLLVTACSRTDAASAAQMHETVVNGYLPRRQRYRPALVARVRAAVQDSARASGLNAAEIDRITITILDQIRQANPATVQAVVTEVQS